MIPDNHSPVIELIKAALWPVIALTIIILFYGPLHLALESLAQRSDDVQTIKVGSVELDIRARDLPRPDAVVSDALKKLNSDLIEELLTYPHDTNPCYSPDEASDQRFAKDTKLAELGLIKLVTAPAPVPADCKHMHVLNVLPLGHDTEDFLLQLISVEFTKKK